MLNNFIKLIKKNNNVSWSISVNYTIFYLGKRFAAQDTSLLELLKQW